MATQLRWLATVATLVVLGTSDAAAQSGSSEAADLYDARFVLEVEGGAAWQSRNDVQIPNDETGTRFSLRDLVGEGPWLAGRVTFTYNLNRKHGLRVLLAPFQYTETGTFATPVDFVGARYEPGIPVTATYKFNSWRVGYRYALYRGDRWRWWVGLTAKIRDAKIELAQGATTSRDTDLGFVPLLHVATTYRFGDHWRLMFEGEGLAGGPGRAFDLALKIGYDLSPQVNLSVGYRTLEGGADIDEVYNFAWFHYAVAAVTWGFPCACGDD